MRNLGLSGRNMTATPLMMLGKEHTSKNICHVWSSIISDINHARREIEDSQYSRKLTKISINYVDIKYRMWYDEPR
jgi:hypothetical protein